MEFWIVVGRELDKNKLKRVLVKSTAGNVAELTPTQLKSFCKMNKVININIGSNHIQGVGMSLLDLPTYKKNDFGVLEQVSGYSEQDIINHGQLLISQYLNSEQQKQIKQEQQFMEDKAKKINDIVERLELCRKAIDSVSKVSDLTNVNSILGSINKYVSRLNTDNVGGSIVNHIQKQGLYGFTSDISDKIKRYKTKAIHDGLSNETVSGYTIDNMCDILLESIGMLRNNYDIAKQTKNNFKSSDSDYFLTESIPIVEEDAEDLVPIDFGNTQDFSNSIPIVSGDSDDLVPIS